MISEFMRSTFVSVGLALRLSKRILDVWSQNRPGLWKEIKSEDSNDIQAAGLWNNGSLATQHIPTVLALAITSGTIKTMGRPKPSHWRAGLHMPWTLGWTTATESHDVLEIQTCRDKGERGRDQEGGEPWEQCGARLINPDIMKSSKAHLERTRNVIPSCPPMPWL